MTAEEAGVKRSSEPCRVDVPSRCAGDSLEPPIPESFMQTFLPYGPDFARNAEVLDSRRLLKQRVEVLQILNALAGRSRGWTRHPAVLMWSGHEGALLRYQEAMCAEVLRRGFSDTCLTQSRDVVAALAGPSFADPLWLTDDRRPRIEITHRGNLHRKDPVGYEAFRGDFEVFPSYTCHLQCQYYWPTHVPAA